MSPGAEIDLLLRRADARLVRQRKHRIFRFPDGRIFVQANTASDVRAEKNSLSVLRRLIREVPA
jgi:hypothetical protein